jgi:sterol desaturase/sphingolipid hydroxylase (fatty acid hydroxylase superfamily)
VVGGAGSKLHSVGETMAHALTFIALIVLSCVSAELLGYGLHRLLHSGLVGFLSRNHMKHHMVLYGPLQPQRSKHYQDATEQSVSLGNIGAEWLIPAALLIACALALFHLFHVRLLYQLIYFAVTLGWSFLMFSYLHDLQHIEGFWMERNRFLKRWFVSARNLHEIHHHVINNQGLMDRNFGIGFFFFDRLFGTLCGGEPSFNYEGYLVARKRFRSTMAGVEEEASNDL